MRKIYACVVVQLSALLMSSVLCPSHVYAGSDGPADGNGKSWATAFRSIDAASFVTLNPTLEVVCV